MLVGLILLSLVILGSVFENPVSVGNKIYKDPVSGEPGIARITERGWSIPVKLPVSDSGREDSTYITRDGNYVLFYHDPNTNLFEETKDVSAVKVYYSKRPFVDKKFHPVSSGGDLNVEGGPYISKGGDFYYHRTDIDVSSGAPIIKPNKILKNGEVLELGVSEVNNGNPHYCDDKNELYFDSPDGEKIAVYKNGKTTTLPQPINLPGTQNLQPFLTDDCQTMYFTSSRAATSGILPLQVYKSRRLGEFSWSDPILFLSYPGIGGVGEFSMTRDGKQIVFTQLTIKDGWGNNDMYYTQRE